MSKVNYKQAAEDARSLNRMFQSVASLVGVLDGIGALEDAERAAQDRVVRARAEAQAAVEATELAKKELAVMKAKVKAAEEQARSLLSTAQEAAAGTAAKADAHLTEAKKQAADAVAQAETRVAKLDGEWRRVSDATATKREEFLAFEAKLDKLRKQAAKFVSPE